VIPLEEAQAFVLDRCQALAPAAVPVAEALGLVTAAPVECGEFIPPFDNTAMDGFAIRSADTAGAPVTLKLTGELAAGARPDIEVKPGEAVRIMTGAPIPPGSDAIVMVELTSTSADGATVEVQGEIPPGNHIRRAGEDLEPGQLVFPAGTILGPGHLGVLCSLGVPTVEAFPKVRVGVSSTGDELVDDLSPLEPGQIRDSNRRTLLAMVAEAGAEPVDLGLARDDEAAIADTLERGAAQCDAVITSGGVSMGEYDYVKVVLDRIGDMAWMQVAIKPAKPLAFGTIGATPVFGLPGNPVSSMVSFELFARPGLRKMMGHRTIHRTRYRGVVEGELGRRADGKTHFARVKVDYADGGWLVRSSGGQGSHQLAAMAWADGLAILPDGDGVGEGDSVDFIPLHGGRA
jgi:molybdopterin molybdotransferase